jgi:rare lipoprotein A
MKKLATFVLAIVFLVATIPVSRAEDFSVQKLKLQRTEAQIKRLIQRSKRNTNRLSDLKIRLSEIQNNLEVLEQQSNARKPRRRLQPVKLENHILNETVQQNTQIQVALETGKASYYGPKLNGRRTASGEVFDDGLFTAAHKTLPFGTRVKVINPANGNSVEVVINDRGPHVAGRIIDLTSAAFSTLDNLSRGVIDVQVEIIDLAK